MNTIPRTDGPSRAATLRSLVAAEAPACEQARTLTPTVVEALWDRGLMTMMSPREAGGGEAGLPEMLDTWQELAWQDGSVGWIGIASVPSTGFAAAYLPEAGFREVFGEDGRRRVAVGGQFAPNGVGHRVEGGYRLDGSWNFGSGTGHSSHVVGGFVVMDGAELRMGELGMPEMLVAVMPREQVNFTDGWHVQGLKGTGSYDYNVRELFVPDHRVFRLFTREPLRGGALFRCGVMPVTAAGHAAWALGVARSVIDDVRELALSKVRMGDMTTLAHKTTFQRNLAHHEGMWRAARALVTDTFSRIGAEVEAGTAITPSMRADMRIAATYATEACREIAQWGHLAAGTSAIREGSRLERAFRDLYTGTQHAFIGEKTYVDAAQIMLGLIEDSPAL